MSYAFTNGTKGKEKRKLRCHTPKMAFRSVQRSYWMSITGACQKAAFWPVGLTTVTWQVYSPGGRLLRGRLNLRFTALDLASGGSVTASGFVSNALVAPR